MVFACLHTGWEGTYDTVTLGGLTVMDTTWRVGWNWCTGRRVHFLLRVQDVTGRPAAVDSVVHFQDSVRTAQGEGVERSNVRRSDANLAPLSVRARSG